MFEEYVIGDNESFNLIDRKTLSSGSTTTTFSGLSGENTLIYKIYYSLKITPSGADTSLALKLNSSTSGYDSTEHYSGTYHGHAIVGGGTYIQITRTTNHVVGYVNGVFYLYPSKTHNIGGYRCGNGSGTIYAPGTAFLNMECSGNWNDTTNEITSITIYTSGGSGVMEGKIRLSKMAPTWGD